MQRQATHDTRELARPRYEVLLNERLWLGKLYADHLSHLDEVTPKALLLFQRLLTVDAALGRYRRYDRDLFARVIPTENERIHQPPDTPADHRWAPCSLCLTTALHLEPGTVLLPAARSAR